MTAPARNVVRTGTPQTAAAPTAAATLQRITTDRARKLIEPMLKPGVTLDRVYAEVYFAVQKNPELIDCTGESLIVAVAQCAAWDLTIGETVHLVKFNTKVRDPNAPNGERWENRAQAIRDYKGDIELVVRSGAARSVDAQCHYEGDMLEYEQGSDPFIKHRPERDSKKRGKLVGAYAVAFVTRLDPPKIVYMNVEEIDAIRHRLSKQWKTGALDLIPWYARKTVVHQVCKLIPKNPRLAAVMASFAVEDGETVDPEAEPPARPYPLRETRAGTPVSQPATEPEVVYEPTMEDVLGERPPQTEPYESFRMPFSWRGIAVGTPLRDVPVEALLGAYEWAKLNNPKGYLNEFVDRAAIVIDDKNA